MDTIGAISRSFGGREGVVGASGLTPRGEAQLDFASVMSTQDRGLAGTASMAADDRTKARRAAEDLVAMTLVQPMLEMAREANQAPPPFGPGEGEKTFGKLLDAQISRSIVRGSGYPLVDRLARDMLREAPTISRLPDPVSLGTDGRAGPLGTLNDAGSGGLTTDERSNGLDTRATP